MEATELQSAVLALDATLVHREKTDRPAVTVPLDRFFVIMKQLREDSRFSFDMLCTHTAIDWLAKDKIELVYQLYSTENRHYLMVSLFLPRKDACVPTVSSIWQIAEWQEREVYDLFGVKYTNHPDLRRLLLEDDWAGFPLLKDYKDDFTLERPW